MEILQNLLENDLLTEETKADLEKAIQTQISEAVETAVKEAREEAEATVRADLAEQFVVDKEALVEALDTKLDVLLEKELNELKDDIDNFRDLEAEFAEKTVQMKAQLAETAKKDFAKLINILDEYLNERVDAEFEELREDIQEVKKNRFGMEVFEFFEGKFESNYFDSDKVERQAKEAKNNLRRVTKELREAQEKLAESERKQTINEVLSNLEGKSREVMAAILDKTPTAKVEAVYEQFLPHVLSTKVEVEDDAEKEGTVLAEDSKPKAEKILKETMTVSGDVSGPKVETAGEQVPHLTESEVSRLRELAGQIG